MSQDAVNQNINLNVSGAEKVAEATALLQDFQGMLQQVLTNPAYSSYAWNKIAHGLEKAFVDPLKKSTQLTQAQGLEFDRLVNKSRALITVTGFISGMAAALAKTTLEIQKASAELGKFTSFNNMPGGASNLFQAQTNIMKMTADNTIAFNEQFAQQTEQVYLELRRKLSAGGMDEKGVRELTKRLALLQAGLGVNAPSFVSGLANQYRLQGLDEKAASQVFGLIMGEVQKGKTLPFFNPQEAAGVFTQGVQQVGGNPLTATGQVLDVMQTYGNKMGPEDMQKLFQTLPQFLNEFKQNATLRGLYGVQQSDLTGDKALVNLANVFAKEVQKVTGGKPIENVMDYINKGGLASSAILERLGIGKDMLQLFNSLPKNQKAVTELADAFERGLGKDTLASTKDLAKTLDQIEEALRNSSSLLEWVGAHWTKISTGIAGGANDLGIDPKVIQAAALGVGVGGLIKFGPKMLRGFLNSIGVPLTSVATDVGTGAKIYDAATGMYIRGGAAGVEGATGVGKIAGTLGKLRKFASIGSRLAGPIGAGITIGTELGEVQALSDKGLSGGDIMKYKAFQIADFLDLPNAYKTQQDVRDRIKRMEMGEDEFIKRLPYFRLIFSEKELTSLVKDSYLGDSRRLKNGIDNIGLPYEMLTQPMSPRTMNIPDFLERQRNPLMKTYSKPYSSMTLEEKTINFLESQSNDIRKIATTTTEDKEEPLLEGGDVGNLRIIISNDAGNELANTTLREAQNQGGLRVIMSAVSEA